MENNRKGPFLFGHDTLKTYLPQSCALHSFFLFDICKNAAASSALLMPLTLLATFLKIKSLKLSLTLCSCKPTGMFYFLSKFIMRMSALSYSSAVGLASLNLLKLLEKSTRASTFLSIPLRSYIQPSFS